MKSRAEQLDEMSKAILIATDRICLLQATGQNASKRDQAADAE